MTPPPPGEAAGPPVGEDAPPPPPPPGESAGLPVGEDEMPPGEAAGLVDTGVPDSGGDETGDTGVGEVLLAGVGAAAGGVCFVFGGITTTSEEEEEKKMQREDAMERVAVRLKLEEEDKCKITKAIFGDGGVFPRGKCTVSYGFQMDM
ncbi:hypothetical protein L1987_19525 [Smallanthus sonchifolius]|uniref:Uncharacterized protein n=1 Tax=Smallanthus sonchifolius TaxID=185202 RepID=A0ACB9IS96_9ASTR|nr:hypothetical protein L1987_19525 [Smallanthus sonchifolius]